MDLLQRLDALQRQGVVMPDPRQVFVDEDVVLARIHPGVVLHPGTRLHGATTLLAPGVQVGTEGPATLRDAVLGEGATVKSGFVHGAVLLAGASVGANGHVRPGCLLEEQASTAHAVGLKHSILLSFVTLGSLINFCDALVAGGTSRKDHSEIGSGVIHFNFTPWGEHGDKATASLLGDVPRGVLLREPRIFVGGLSGLVGPVSVGYGSLTVAGQVVRRDVPEARLVREAPRGVDVAFEAGSRTISPRKLAANLRYLGNLFALRAWYVHVRRPGAAPGHRREVVDAAIALLGVCIAERSKRLNAWLVDVGETAISVADPGLPCPEGLAPAEPVDDHVAWVRGLDEARCDAARAWLSGIVEATAEL